MQHTSFDAKNIDSPFLAKTFDKEGYVIIRNALSREALQTLQDDLEPHFEQRPMSHGLFWGKKTTRIEGVLNKSAISHDMVLNDAVLSLVEHTLSPYCDNYHLHITQGIRIHPGERAQVIHPDSAMYPIAKTHEFMVNAIWAVDDFTEENGATRIVPGSHLWPEGRQPEPHEIIQAEMKAGDVLIYRASLLHGGGANVTENTHRTGLAISYSLGWLRQSENMYLTYPPHIARHFNEKLQRLIGYNVHRPNLGWVNGHDPITLLNGASLDGIGAEDFLTEEQTALLEQFYAGQELAVVSHTG
jgi:ectoine hydroxylase-related dioxygenase (phytanoyl-CoA dioxygenase family)